MLDTLSLLAYILFWVWLNIAFVGVYMGAMLSAKRGYYTPVVFLVSATVNTIFAYNFPYVEVTF